MVTDGRGTEAEVLWSPRLDGTSRMEAFVGYVNRTMGLGLRTYDDVWSWSVTEPAAFWESVGGFFAPPASGSWYPALPSTPKMPEPNWFSRLRLNYAEIALSLPGRGCDDVVVIARSQTRPDITLTASELRSQVAGARAGLVARGVVSGGTVAAYAPNIPETLILMLAAASVGATFVSCSPELGVKSVVDRLSQVGPSVLLAVRGYRYGTKDVERGEQVAHIVRSIGSVKHVIEIDYLEDVAPLPIAEAVPWEHFLVPGSELEFDRVSADHPLCVLFSSGTTGLPKPIVHSHGGISAEHLKFLGLHLDLGPGDRFFWYSTTSWMMWNILISGLAVGSTVVLFDGDPAKPDALALWRLAADLEVTYFGVSAPFLIQCAKEQADVAGAGDLRRLRFVGSTGAPLSQEGARWVTANVPAGVQLQSIAGGTDVCSAFVGSSPMVPVYAGRIPSRCLGVDVQAVDDAGRVVVGDVGEMVIRRPMPSMPVRFENDHDGSRYRAAYFETFPGMWRHGDWVRFEADGSCVISGRSDATLNRGGVRLGTSEFYAVTDQIPHIADSLIVHVESENGGPGQLLLFVQPMPDAPGVQEVADDVRRRLLGELSPRHLPDRVFVVRTLPRTVTGKRLEVPVKRMCLGASPDEVVAAGSVDDPDALEDLARLIETDIL